MYIITDVKEIASAIDNKAPRDVETILREMYPDCTIDANGRAHAPCDGYLCEFTDIVYRGGEYLPESEEAAIGSSTRRMFCLDVLTGNEIIFEGTNAQITSAREIAKQQQLDFDATSNFVGEVKKREVFDLRVCAVFHNFGEYGDVFTHLMRDENMNPVVYKGNKKLALAGGNLRMKATVKSHWSSPDKSRKATYINRPANVVNKVLDAA